MVIIDVWYFIHVHISGGRIFQVALGLACRCSCGENFKIYLPKDRLYTETVSRVVDWQAIDAREQADGEVEDVRRIAESTGTTFIDGRHSEKLVCPCCTTVLDLIQHFRDSILSVLSPRPLLN